MVKYLRITLTNGKISDKSEKLHILCSKGFEYYTVHISLECSKFSIDTAESDYAMCVTMNVDESDWWKTTIEFLLGCLCASSLISIPDWITLTPEMFGADRWTVLD